jgi:hypothetical protein
MYTGHIGNNNKTILAAMNYIKLLAAKGNKLENDILKLNNEYEKKQKQTEINSIKKEINKVMSFFNNANQRQNATRRIEYKQGQNAAQRPANPYMYPVIRYSFPTINAARALARRYSTKLNEKNLKLLVQKLFIEMKVNEMLQQELSAYFINGNRKHVTAVINDRQRLINTKVPPRIYTSRRGRFAIFLNMLKHPSQR